MKVNGNRFRRKRFEHFLGLIRRAAQSLQEIRILDIGGTRDYWVALQEMWSSHPIYGTILDREGGPGSDVAFQCRMGDAWNLRTEGGRVGKEGVMTCKPREGEV